MAGRSNAVGNDLDARLRRAFMGQTAKAMKQGKPLPPAVLADIKVGAVQHPDPDTRRWCLFLLDHYANDQSTAVFAQALHDDTAHVRGMALHGIACEPCKEGDLCVADVVPPIVDVLRHDPDADLRIKAMAVLLGLVDRDPRIREAIRAALMRDPDPLVRKCARDALDGHFVMPKKRFERSQRRHTVGKH